MAKIKVADLLTDFQRMLDERWEYVAGSAEEGKVDCSGAFVWSYRQHGKSIYHGSNRIARQYVCTLLPITAAEPGMIAFKAKEPGEEGYSLPDSYKQGGEYHNGDLNDYYHVGLVAQDGYHVLNAQSTATGFVSSPITQNWDCVACLTEVDYDGEPQPVPESKKYTVTGGRLNLREKPNKKSAAIRSLANGEIVEKVGESGDWFKVKAGRETGYAQKQFLKPIVSPEYDGEQEYIYVSKAVLTALKSALNEALNTIGGMLNED